MRKVKQSGAALMKARGNKAVTVWLDAAELAVLKKAAGGQVMKLATYVRLAALAMAEGRSTLGRYY